MVDFRAIIENLKDMHFYDVILPFLLVYVVVFAILEKSKIFKVSGGNDENKHVKNVNAIIALVFALFVVASLQTVLYIQSLIINIVLFIIFILVMLIVLGFIFGEDYKQLIFEKDGDNWKIRKWAAWTIGIIVLIVGIVALMYATDTIDPVTDFFDDLFNGTFDSDSFWTIVVIAALGGVIYWISKEDSNTSSSS